MLSSVLPTIEAPKPLKEEGRICLFCEHFRVHMAEPDCSEYTPGSNFSIECTKHHWSFDPYADGQVDYARCLATAQNCPEYQFSERIMKELSK